MSQSATTCFVVTFHYQEAGLTDLAKLTSQLTREGFTTTLADKEGISHELGSNTFALITMLNQHDVHQLAQGLGEVALGKTPDVTISTFDQYVKQLHAGG
ncbi:type V toxin-antitoxin system endoribonuclease antitoxin GhoS [Serratia sp. NPDC078593]|uniref:type V toxin-antitoxin system endoribonuclease antitoxin GhoS n=1 Tax=unclassified Serratia (in: enterobacteria) TaxID=2647522 RepID=UPI0037CD0962